MSRTDNLDRVRQAFADQFEQDGSNFIDRRSQKGEAIRVSADERRQFIEEFDRNLRRATWIIYVGVTLVLGGTIILSVFKGINVSRGAIFIGFGLGMIPYFAFYRWAWATPTRALRSRTPVAGERPSDEVRRIQFQRMTYGQLAGAAFGGVMAILWLWRSGFLVLRRSLLAVPGEDPRCKQLGLGCCDIGEVSRQSAIPAGLEDGSRSNGRSVSRLRRRADGKGPKRRIPHADRLVQGRHR